MVQALPKAPTQVKPAAPAKSAGGKHYLSYGLLALAALFILDLSARLSYQYWNIDRFDSPNKSWIWWAVSDFHRQPQTPDIVLLGSSLMLEALNTGDATYLHKAQNVSLHHTSSCLQDDLQAKLGYKPHTFSFAIAGQMASDAYAIASTLLRGKDKPTTIVYGIAPRDFMDNTLTNVTTTETFRYLARVGDLSKTFAAAKPSFFEVMDRGLENISFIYKHRVDLLCMQQHAFKSLLEGIGHRNLDTYKVPFELRRIALKDLLEDVASNETMVCPYGDPPVPYLDNLAEYRQRYAHMNARMFKNQLGYLEQLLQYGKDQKINVVLINMPLTSDNVALMPPGFYQNYLTQIQTLSAKYDSKLIDMNLPGTFNRGYFADSAHLNGLGGMRFFDLLSQALVANHVELRKSK
ncbi:MAG: hypothetical protein EKK48_02185 [Candidatus Melainabacteria bacterium]|nr:MAG: hypothetical protein EKK48_02185 [Candidatus Melainabacteria bacterium]